MHLRRDPPEIGTKHVKTNNKFGDKNYNKIKSIFTSQTIYSLTVYNMIKKPRLLPVFLENSGLLVNELHYGPYSRFWWDFSTENNVVNFLIRLNQQVKVFLNGNDFFLTVKKGARNLPEYHCKSGEIEVFETSPTKAVEIVYKDIFKSFTRYSGHAIMGWNNENILEILKNDIEFFPVICTVGKYKIFLYTIGYSLNKGWMYAGSGYEASIIHVFDKKQGILVSKIENEDCIVEIYQDSQLKKRVIGTSPDDVWRKTGLIQNYNGTQLFGLDNSIIQQLIKKHRVPTCKLQDWQDQSIMQILFDYHLKRRTLANINWHQFFISWAESNVTIIDLKSNLKPLYPHNYKFDEREFRAWKAMLHASGCTNITPWSHDESEVNSYHVFRISIQVTNSTYTMYQIEMWTKSPDPTTEQETLADLFKIGLLTSIPIHMPNATCTFWTCFERALSNNKRTYDGKRRILSIIAEDFTYDELQNNLGVSTSFNYYK